MSIPFSDTTTRRGLVQLYEKEIGANYGDVSGNTDALDEFTAEVNIGLDKFRWCAIKGAARWQDDDTNFDENYPIVRADLISGQRDYPILQDEDGNQILEIYKVAIAGPDGIFREASPVDVQTEEGTSSFYDGNNLSGTPNRYDKTANGIIVDPIPNYSMRLANEGQRGILAYVNREGSYFISSDTTKKPGVPGIFHDYFYLRASREKSRRDGLKNYESLNTIVTKMEGDESLGIVGTIEKYFAYRDRHERKRLTAGITDCR